MLRTVGSKFAEFMYAIPVLAGFAWNLSGLGLPTVADEILQTLGQAVVPLCLVLIGMSLAYYGTLALGAVAVGEAGRVLLDGRP